MTEHNEQIYLKVKFKGVRREICQNPNALPLETGEPVIVEADRGEDLGFVLAPSHNPKLPENGEPPCPILRRATAQEVAKFHENRNREKLAQQFCLKKIQELNLPMNLIDVDPVPSSWNDPLYPDLTYPVSEPYPLNPARYKEPRHIRMGLSLEF